MDNFNKDQFKKLNSQEKDKAINDLVLQPVDILCKSVEDLFTTKPLVIKPPNQLFIEFLHKAPPLKNGDEIIGQFLFNRENLYIFSSKYFKQANTSSLILDSDFYMIQRRENYRLKFPTALNSKVTIKSNQSKMAGRVVDLSTTGICLGSADIAEFMSIGTEVEMEIQVSGHAPLNITAHMRHRTKGKDFSKEKKTDYFYYGFQFVRVSSENEKSLTRINMELYRNFLQKVNG